MTLKPYAEYEVAAAAESKEKHKGYLLPAIAVCAVVGAIIGAVAYGSSRGVGAGIGAAIGLIVGPILKWYIAKSEADELAAENYTKDWCTENGCRVIEGDVSPPNGPHADDGFKQKATDAIEGTFADHKALFYNFSYWTKSTDGDGGTTDTEHAYKILQLTGKKLPIARLSWAKRGTLDRFSSIDKLQGALSPERPIQLESVEFNKLFDLTIDDHADDIWIRRIFDPATIDDCIKGTISIPNLRYYDEAWWLVENKHFKAKDLETMKDWQARAAVAIDHLARVQVL